MVVQSNPDFFVADVVNVVFVSSDDVVVVIVSELVSTVDLVAVVESVFVFSTDVFVAVVVFETGCVIDVDGNVVVRNCGGRGGTDGRGGGPGVAVVVSEFGGRGGKSGLGGGPGVAVVESEFGGRGGKGGPGGGPGVAVVESEFVVADNLAVVIVSDLFIVVVFA